MNEYLSLTLIENQNLIRLADRKANIILVLIGTIVSIFFRFLVTSEISSQYQIYLILIPFLTSGYFAFLTIFPRTSKNSSKPSLLYFKSSKNLNTNKIVKDLLEPSEKEIYTDYVENIKALATVIDKKYKYLKYAYIFLAIAILFKIIFETIIWIL